MAKSNEMNHLMVDIETLGAGKRSPILSIGAQWFTVEGLQGEGFYTSISVEQNYAAGRNKPEAGALTFWLQQPDEARAALFESPNEGVVEALVDFVTFIKSSCPEYRKAVVWAKPPGYDLRILKAACELHEVEWPFMHRQEACFRTLSRLNVPGTKVAKNEAKHNALADARHQAEHASKILKKLEELSNQND